MARRCAHVEQRMQVAAEQLGAVPAGERAVVDLAVDGADQVDRAGPGHARMGDSRFAPVPEVADGAGLEVAGGGSTRRGRRRGPGGAATPLGHRAAERVADDTCLSSV